MRRGNERGGAAREAVARASKAPDRAWVRVSKSPVYFGRIRAVAFDLQQFRDLAFGRQALPDHQLQSVRDAEEVIAALPSDSHAALAELTSLVRSMNETDSFSPGLRARVLMTLDEAARPRWRELGREHLAPHGKPLARDGDVNILRALFDSASEFTDGYALALDAGSPDATGWMMKNAARVNLRSLRWLARRLALSHQMHLPVTAAIWERIHRRHALAEQAGVAKLQQPVFDGNRFTSSVRQEYVRCLLLELAGPESLSGRQVELAFRVTGRVASAVRLDAARSDGTVFAVIPFGDARPIVAHRLKVDGGPAPLYIDTTLALPKLRAALERDMGRDQKEPDTTYSSEFTLGERFAMMERLLELWGMDPPQRRTKRVSMAAPARVISGFENVVNVLPAIVDADKLPKAVDLQLRIDDTTRTLSRARVRAATRVGPARVIDASNGGLGIAVRRQDAKWAALGVLLAVCIEPGKEWVVGVLRRIFSVGEEEIRLGIQVLSTRPAVLSVSPETIRRDSVWEEAMKFEAIFKERYKKAIVLDAAAVPPASGELLLEPGASSQGSQFDVPLARAVHRIRIARMLHTSDAYQRVMYETLK